MQAETIEMTVPVGRMKRSSRAVGRRQQSKLSEEVEALIWRAAAGEVHLFSGRWGLKAHSVSI